MDQGIFYLLEINSEEVINGFILGFLTFWNSNNGKALLLERYQMTMKT